jgi:SAM-dependent methyltransferase
MKPEEGLRFIEVLVNVGLVEQFDGRLELSRFSRSYLSRSSATSQRHVLAFEPLLMESWSKLGVVLHEGQGALIRERTEDECRKRQHLFQRAMAETALVRSRELWDSLAQLPELGTIIDIGAGDGTYLREFLVRHPGWQAIACDLPEVCSLAAVDPVQQNLNYYSCNILDKQELDLFVTSYSARADLLIFSNICHCYGPDEVADLLYQAGCLVTEDGLLVVHDFFRDASSFGALYDLHMLVNTYNGRSYTTAETTAMLEQAGFGYNVRIELPSHSVAIVASRKRPVV